MERTVLVGLQFDGTHFAGWQRQPQGRTVQGAFEAVLARLCGSPVVAHAAGRTDAGVHALGMAVSATVPARWTPDALGRALNALLPSDCWVQQVVETRSGFHARKCATARTYEYRVGTDPASRSPFRRPYEWALGRGLDLAQLHRAAELLPGRHDFRTLAVQTGGRRNCRCQVREARWAARACGGGLRFEITADRFLHHMVRMLVGTMMQIAQARRPVEDLALLLEGDGAVRASPPAPAEGLYFVRAEYPPHWFPDPASAT
ncbi:MAG TPA: tRNA pseudouridine(38-40) synthase TruA [Gemmatimonadales bacterium]